MGKTHGRIIRMAGKEERKTPNDNSEGQITMKGNAE